MQASTQRRHKKTLVVGCQDVTLPYERINPIIPEMAPPQGEELLPRTSCDARPFDRLIKNLSFLDLHCPVVDASSGVSGDRQGNDSSVGFHLALQMIRMRIDKLLEELETRRVASTAVDAVADEKGQYGDDTRSRVRDACERSLRTKMQVLLDQSLLLAECLEVEAMTARLRTTFSLAAAFQYLETISFALSVADPASSDYCESLDSALQMIQVRNAKGDGADPLPLQFRVSHWLVPRLAFDASVGNKANMTIFGDGGDIPLSIDIEPVVSYLADELSRNVRPRFLRRCAVDIQKCTHKEKRFARAGAMGVAIVRVAVSPIMEEGETHEVGQIWGQQEGEKITITEARV